MGDPVHLRLVQQPTTRVECLPGGYNQARPCSWTSCPYHLGSEKRARDRGIVPLTPAEEDASTCVLDLADRGGMTLEEVGAVLGRTRERVRQIESNALRKLAKRGIILSMRQP